ncbi:MAG: hypothetical protein ACYDAN_17500 [Candidatus Limnocylindrales bacterium]
MEHLQLHRLDARSYHEDQAATVGDAGAAHRVTLRAARAAEDERSHEQAARLWRRARRHLELEPALGDRSELLECEATAFARAGMVEDAWAAARELAAHGRRTGSPSLLARAALVVRGIEGYDADIAELCDEALAALPSGAA